MTPAMSAMPAADRGCTCAARRHAGTPGLSTQATVTPEMAVSCSCPSGRPTFSIMEALQ
jgi:hypothetical protein